VNLSESHQAAAAKTGNRKYIVNYGMQSDRVHSAYSRPASYLHFLSLHCFLLAPLYTNYITGHTKVSERWPT